MNKKKYRSIGVNAVLNTLKSGLNIIFPLFTYPYAFRVLHASGMEKVGYANSIVGYFAMIAALGIGTYAIRKGSKLRDDKFALEKFASQVFSINMLTTVISYALLGLGVVFIPQLKPYSALIMLLSLSTGFNTVGIGWMNPIYEDYLYVTIRSIVTHLVSLVLLFVLVRRESDYYYYSLIIVITPAIICLMNWIRYRKYLSIKITFDMDMGKHIKPIMIMFAHSLATSIYVGADTTMLGIFFGDVTVGLYSIAVKIYSVVKRLLVAMYGVAIPRMAYHWGQNDVANVREVFSKVISNLILILFPASVGIICLAKEIIIFMGGAEYTESVLTLQILCVALIGAILGGAVTYCLNVPIGLEKRNLKATVISAIVNVVLNLLILPIWKQNGAAFSTVVSEFIVVFYCVFTNKRFKEFIDFGRIRTCLIHALTGCFSIIFISFWIHRYVDNVYLSMVIIMGVSCLLYFGELLLLGNELAISAVKKLRSKLPFGK